jgi:hypothetical protein
MIGFPTIRALFNKNKKTNMHESERKAADLHTLVFTGLMAIKTMPVIFNYKLIDFFDELTLIVKNKEVFMDNKAEYARFKEDDDDDKKKDSKEKLMKKANIFWKNKRKYKHKSLRRLQQEKGKFYANDINENNI